MMKPEKVVKSLMDLQEAAALAAKDGVCRIRLTSGESLVVYRAESFKPDEEIHDVTDPEERAVVLSCLEPEGKVYAEREAREELKRRLASIGIGQADEAR